MKNSAGGGKSRKMWIYCQDSAIYGMEFVNAAIGNRQQKS